MNPNDSPPIQIKANREGFTLVPDPAASFDAMFAYLEQRLSESRDFFQAAEMTLDLRERPLLTDEISKLHSLLAAKGRVRVVEVKLGEEFSLGAGPPV